MTNDPLPMSPSSADDLSRERAEEILRRLAGPLLAAPAQSSERSPSTRQQEAISSRNSPLLPPPTHALNATSLLTLLEALPDALVIIDRYGRIVVVNAQTERLFGYQREELLGSLIEVLVPERFRVKHVGDRTGFFNKPTDRPMGAGLQLVGRHKDGHEIPVEISLSSIRTEGGTLAVGSIRDVTERRKSEALLQKMEVRYRTLVEGIPAVTFMAAMDEEKNELYVSPQIEALLGFTQKEWLDNPILWYTQLHPDDQVRWHKEFAHTCATAEPFRSVYRFIARDGRVVWVHGEARVIRDEAGRPLFLQGVAFDITGMKQAEEELKALNATLDEKVAERTAELIRSNQALEQFGYVVTHDLRAPLRSMKSYIQMLSERYREHLDAKADDWILRAVNAADRMRVMIEDLLTYSRVRTRGEDPIPVPSAEALSVACTNLHAAIEEAGARVSASELPLILADASQLVSLFQNLIGNALKFRGDKPPEIRVSAWRREREWVFEVSDNGIGIEPEYLKRIFGLGERLHSASKYPGNGIGLATCETIVQRHGGQIWAESEGLGMGATMKFTMPAVSET